MNRSNQIENDEDAREQQDFSDMRAMQIHCILRTVGEAIGKIKMSLALPEILERSDELPTILRNTPYEKVITSIMEEYVARRDYLVHSSPAPLMDHRLVRMIDLLQENYQMHELFRQATSSTLNCDDRKLLQAFDLLYEVAEYHFRRSAKMTLNKERELHRTYNKNEALKSNINEMQQQSNKLNIKILWRAIGKRVLLQKYDADMKSKTFEKSCRVQNEINKCISHIDVSHKKSGEKQKDLEEELERLKLQYDVNARQNSEKEEEVRAENNKLLLQLQNSIKKYDETFIEKIREKLILKDEYEEAQKKLDEFMVIFRQEEAIYAEIVLKPEEEERLNRKRLAVLFMMNRAARKIQRYWRAWRKGQVKKGKRVSVVAIKKKKKKK